MALKKLPISSLQRLYIDIIPAIDEPIIACNRIRHPSLRMCISLDDKLLEDPDRLAHTVILQDVRKVANIHLNSILAEEIENTRRAEGVTEFVECAFVNEHLITFAQIFFPVLCKRMSRNRRKSRGHRIRTVQDARCSRVSYRTDDIIACNKAC